MAAFFCDLSTAGLTRLLWRGSFQDDLAAVGEWLFLSQSSILTRNLHITENPYALYSTYQTPSMQAVMSDQETRYPPSYLPYDAAADVAARRWREFIVPSSNALMGELWETYKLSCQYRNESPMLYVEFLPLTKHLAFKGLPQLWEDHAEESIHHGRLPESFLEFAAAMNTMFGAGKQRSGR
jgi:hypothetical protein